LFVVPYKKLFIKTQKVFDIQETIDFPVLVCYILLLGGRFDKTGFVSDKNQAVHG